MPIVELLRADIRVTKPPMAVRYDGVAEAARFFTEILEPQSGNDFRLIATRANRQPAAASYLREPGQDRWRALSLDVLEIENGQLVEITTFLVPEMFALFGLPSQL